VDPAAAGPRVAAVAKRFKPAGGSVSQKRFRPGKAKPRVRDVAARNTPAARRRRRQDKDPLLNPAAQLSGHNLARAASALTGYEFGPQFSENRRQARQARAQGNALVSRNQSYYRRLANEEAGRVNRQRVLGSDLDRTLASISRDTGSSIDQAGRDTRQAGGQDAALRGPGLSGGGTQATLEELAAQRARSAQTAQAYRSGAALETANYGGLVNSLGGATRLHGAESRRELVNREQNVLRDLATQRRSLQQQRGLAKLKNVTSLRQSGFDNAVTLRGLGLKEEDIQSRSAQAAAAAALAARRQRDTERNNKRQARLARQRNATTRRGQTLGHRDRVRGQDLGHHDRQDSLRARNRKKTKNKESQSSHNVKLQIDNARSSIRQYRAKGLTGPQISRRARRAGVPNVVLNAARDLEYLGYISGPNRAALRRAGVRVPRAWLRKPRRSKAARGINFGL
jgi:hypothetical protein